MNTAKGMCCATGTLLVSLLVACSTAPTGSIEPQSVPAAFRVNRGAGPRELPPLPKATKGTPAGAEVTLEGLWAGYASTTDTARVRCSVDPTDGKRDYIATSQAMDDFRGVENYPREDYYMVLVSVGDKDSHGDDEDEPAAAVVIMFADETGTLVQMFNPDSDSVAVHSSDDDRVIDFSMINAAPANRNSGSPTTAVGTISCPQ